MRTAIKETKVFTFDELSEEAKDKAIENLYDINIFHDWFESVYDDAEQIGLKIINFDIDRGSYCHGHFTVSANEVAENILRNHGDKCQTYKTADEFLLNWQPIFDAYMDENSAHYESYASEKKLQELEDDFLKSLLEDYRIILSQEYDYLTSREAIIETIEANNYEFTEDGKLY